MHSSICRSPPSLLIPSQIKAVLAPISLLEHKFNIILPSTRRSSKWSLSLGFPHQNSEFNCHTCHVHHPPQSSLDLPDATRSVYIIKVLITQSTPVPSYLVRLRHKYPPQHPILETLSLCFPLSVNDQVWYPCKTIGKLQVYISEFCTF